MYLFVQNSHYQKVIYYLCFLACYIELYICVLQWAWFFGTDWQCQYYDLIGEIAVWAGNENTHQYHFSRPFYGV